MFQDDRMIPVLSAMVLMTVIGTFLQRIDGVERFLGGAPEPAAELRDDEIATPVDGVVRIDVFANDDGVTDEMRRDLYVASAPACGRLFVRDGVLEYLPEARCAGRQTIRYSYRGAEPGMVATVTASVQPSADQRSPAPAESRAPTVAKVDTPASPGASPPPASPPPASASPALAAGAAAATPSKTANTPPSAALPAIAAADGKRPAGTAPARAAAPASADAAAPAPGVAAAPSSLAAKAGLPSAPPALAAATPPPDAPAAADPGSRETAGSTAMPPAAVMAAQAAGEPNAAPTVVETAAAAPLRGGVVTGGPGPDGVPVSAPASPEPPPSVDGGTAALAALDRPGAPHPVRREAPMGLTASDSPVAVEFAIPSAEAEARRADAPPLNAASEAAEPAMAARLAALAGMKDRLHRAGTARAHEGPARGSAADGSASEDAGAVEPATDDAAAEDAAAEDMAAERVADGDAATVAERIASAATDGPAPVGAAREAASRETATPATGNRPAVPEGAMELAALPGSVADPVGKAGNRAGTPVETAPARSDEPPWAATVVAALGMPGAEPGVAAVSAAAPPPAAAALPRRTWRGATQVAAPVVTAPWPARPWRGLPAGVPAGTASAVAADDSLRPVRHPEGAGPAFLLAVIGHDGSREAGGSATVGAAALAHVPGLAAAPAEETRVAALMPGRLVPVAPVVDPALAVLPAERMVLPPRRPARRAPGEHEPVRTAAVDPTAAPPAPAGSPAAARPPVPAARVVPATVEPAAPAVRAVPAAPCLGPPELTLEVRGAGETIVGVAAPCHAATVAELTYSGLRLAVPLDGNGQGVVRVLGFEPNAPALLTFRGGAVVDFELPFKGVERVSRVALAWDAPVELELNALEYGAAPGTAGHVRPGLARSFEAVRRTGGGYLSVWHPVAGLGQSLQVYSWFHRSGETPGVVKLLLDFVSRDRDRMAATCGNGPDAAPQIMVLRSNEGRPERPMVRRLAPVDCGRVARQGPDNRLISGAVDDLVIMSR